MVAGGLSFEQEIIKAIVGALATAVFVTIGGGLVAGLATRWWQDRREQCDMRTSLLDRAARVAQEMYVVCQYTRRVLRDNRGDGEEAIKRRTAVLAALDEAYLRFSAESAALETVLGARYGIVWTPAAKTVSHVFWRWHQIRDLLVIYYFNLHNSLRDDLLKRNSQGFEGNYHSGLDLPGFIKDVSAPTAGELSAMRRSIRRSYDEALADLAKAMMNDKITAG